MKQESTKKIGNRFSIGQQSYLTILLVLLALVAVATVTAAWFSIADRTNVYSMSMDVSAGPSLRFDLYSHSDFKEYRQTLSFDEIASYVVRQSGYDMHTTQMEPVTTENYEVFTLRNGEVRTSDTGSYWEFPLHFMGTEDMVVHLTAQNSSDRDDGTRISSSKVNLPQSMRICFETDGNHMIYDPGMGDSAEIFGKNKIFGLQLTTNTWDNDNSVLFSLPAYTDKTVIVRIWMEGTDEACTDELKESDFAIYMRFEGTDENGYPLTGKRVEEMPSE